MKNGLKKEDSMALKGLAVMMMVFITAFIKHQNLQNMMWLSEVFLQTV